VCIVCVFGRGLCDTHGMWLLLWPAHVGDCPVGGCVLPWGCRMGCQKQASPNSAFFWLISRLSRVATRLLAEHTSTRAQLTPCSTPTACFCPTNSHTQAFTYSPHTAWAV
jgi:hypothetical protein